MAELTWRAVDLRRTDGSVWTWIERGWLDEPADHRGEDTPLPGKPGRARGNRVADRRVIVMRTHLKAATRAAMLALQQEMAALWNPSLDPGALVLADGYRGLGAGQTATLQAAFVNVTPAAAFTEYHREYSVQAECIADPPNWVIAP